MTRGRTRSRLTLSERREEASSLFLKGFTVTDVARKLGVEWDTAKGYKEWHEARIEEQAKGSPQLLSDVLRNTVLMIEELDQVRAAAWRQYHSSESRQTKLQALNTIRAAQTDKAKLFGLFGVKQDFYVHVQNVTLVQNKLIEFLTRELCEEDRAKLEHFLMSPELQQYMGAANQLPLIELGEGEYEEAEIVDRAS